MAEGGALLRRYTGLNPYRGFESLSLRQLNCCFSSDRALRAPVLGHVLGQSWGRTIGAVFFLYDKPKDEWLNWSPKIPVGQEKAEAN